MGPYLPVEVAHACPLLVVNLGGLVHEWGGWVVKLCYLNWSDDASCKTWSQMCGSWYFAKFLLSEGSLAHINIASLMFLVIPCDSLSTVVKQPGLIGCSVEQMC